MIEILSRKLNMKELEEIGLKVAQFAEVVDQKAKFPEESIRLLKEHKLLSAYIPTSLGGQGMNIVELVEIGKVLGKSCASTGMIWAMHQTQVACLVHHSLDSEAICNSLRNIAENEYLIASITSEVGTGGDIGRSIAGLDLEGNYGFLTKKGSVVSYGNYAEAFLATAKKSKDANETNQSLVLLNRDDMEIEQTSEWDTLGMRGTCSPGFTIKAKFSLNHVLNLPYRDISTQTMVPFSHILWSSVWYGIANEAFMKARKLSKIRMKNLLRNGNQNYEDTKLVTIHHKLNLMQNNLEKYTLEYADLTEDLKLNVDMLNSLDFSLQINNLKVISSELAVEIVQNSLFLCGFSGFQNNNKFSVGRNLRDILSSVVMIHNDRLNKTSSSLLLLQR
ncbi:acyl-CoA dehydrogenase family protein [Bacillus cereus group sp. MYBK108-2]|uniref:acyl-CoA dehydrogenase family protein n=1 Tax=unclassified Bacillus cereus group TaxID=2750818 RepID=UPI00288F9387|nr:acyl-CoA/acyl-ACP dehydrogenase [Bacillus cereus]MDA2307632.1 acyl-CoA/acyl-ACP dehydrogenase [Bacillus cereus]HDX9634235.1 acyl-CoA/acyl-ACP dehydrogenase [Bacillus cereus]HEF1897122.1 acyl-CoA/acyl-ACP dehydrogenase [Bacillus cereus]